MIDTIITLMLGIWLGACSGFIVAGLFGGIRDDEDEHPQKQPRHDRMHGSGVTE